MSERRRCPSCGKNYGAEYADTFCGCGTELMAAPQADVPEIPKPPKGTPCLVLFDAERQPINYFPLTKDVMAIGRLDPVDGNFPDIDLNEWLDPADARKVSRKHALVLRTRATQQFRLRPLAGNTGTQLEADMIDAMQDYPLKSGMRIILAGAVRFKFEVV